MRVGSICSGIGGLEHAIGGGVGFVAEIDRHASAVLAERYPGVPNLGDWTTLDELPACDLLVGGLPCQPISTAGHRAGINDERWLFDDLFRIVGRMDNRPDLFLENVAAIRTLDGGTALSRVVHGLARLGYWWTYGCLEAAAVGAPHRRNRWWLYASADPDRLRRERRITEPQGPRQQTVVADRVPPLMPTPAASDGSRGPDLAVERLLPTPAAGLPNDGEDPAGWLARYEHHATKAEGVQTRAGMPLAVAVKLLPTATAQDSGGSGSAGYPATATHSPGVTLTAALVRDLGATFAEYAPAIRRWERTLGRAAPEPRTGKGQLSARFVEWMMGYPAGWVTDVVDRRPALRCLGNAVVPQCAEEAFWQLADTARLGSV